MNSALALYLSVGCVLWLACALIGAVRDEHRRMIATRGSREAKRITILSTLYLIVLWPVLVGGLIARRVRR